MERRLGETPAERDRLAALTEQLLAEGRGRDRRDGKRRKRDR